jgi:GNAT superfamily N-acetyltransferase
MVGAAAMRQNAVVPHPTLHIEAYRCGPQDLEPMLDRLETLLHEDYFFRRKHFEAILKRPQATVFAILVEGDFAAIAITYNGSTLTNLYVHPEQKRQGVGTAVLAWINPSTVRAKGNMSQGDPVGFYEKNGYKAVGADPIKPHIVLMEKAPPPAPTTTQNGKPPISEAKREHLNKIRAKSIARRQVKKALADYDRLLAANLPHVKALELATGNMQGEGRALALAELATRAAPPPAPPTDEPVPGTSTWPWPD